MKLFKYKDYTLTISDEAYALKPFKRLVDRDRTKEKTKSMKELAYIYFMHDPRSDFSFEINDKDRDERVKMSLGIDPDWSPDKQVEEAIELYKYLTTTTSSLLLQSTKDSIENVRTALTRITFTETDEKGRPLYNLAQVVGAIKLIPGLVKELADAEKAVAKEIEEVGAMRGLKQKSILEDGFKQFLNNDSISN
jgi:hypothetical protein